MGLPLITVGVLLTLLGASISLYGLLYLRRNFSVFVEVREVVFSGPYRHVRHPLYAGEIALFSGVVVISPSIFTIAVACVFIVLQYLRARMEEARLCEVSPLYRERMRTSGVFLPRLAPRKR